MPDDRRRWHYTTGEKWALIVISGNLIPAAAFVPKKERPAVWFSTTPEWERMANKALVENGVTRRLSMKDTSDNAGGIFRIEVAPEVAPHSWEQFKQMNGITPVWAKAIEKTAKEQGSFTSHWRITFNAVPRSKWLAVEQFDWTVHKWAPVEGWQD